MVREKNRTIKLTDGYVMNNSFVPEDLEKDGVYKCYYYLNNKEEAEALEKMCEELAIKTWGELPPEYTSPVQKTTGWYERISEYWLLATSIYPPTSFDKLQEFRKSCFVDLVVKPVAFDGKYKKGILLNLVSISRTEENENKLNELKEFSEVEDEES